MMQLHCSLYLNNTYHFYWRSMGCAMLAPNSLNSLRCLPKLPLKERE